MAAQHVLAVDAIRDSPMPVRYDVLKKQILAHPDHIKLSPYVLADLERDHLPRTVTRLVWQLLFQRELISDHLAQMVGDF